MKIKNIFQILMAILVILNLGTLFADQTSDLVALQSQYDEKAITQKTDIVNIQKTVNQNSQLFNSQAMAGQQNFLNIIDQNKTSSGALIFVSLSMPTLALRQILVESQTYQIPVVIRGLVNNDFAQTTKRLYEILHPDNQSVIDSGVEINPGYFKTFEINQVPAIVTYHGLTHCAASSECQTPNFDVVYGNIPIAKALTIIAETGSDAPDIARQKLNSVGKNNEIA